jgi:hypothetical protein
MVAVEARVERETRVRGEVTLVGMQCCLLVSCLHRCRSLALVSMTAIQEVMPVERGLWRYLWREQQSFGQKWRQRTQARIQATMEGGAVAGGSAGFLSEE